MEQKNVSSVWDIVEKTIRKNKQSDLFFKAFLKPIQVALKTYETEKDRNKQGCMAYGIKLALKENIQANKTTLINFDSIQQGLRKLKDSYQKVGTNQQDKIKASHIQDQIKTKSYEYETIKQANCDNLISLLKSTNQKIKIAICICMYSQDKSQLKKTLAGVQQNIVTFARNGVQPDEIGVFVIMDGIEPADQSIESYFEELEQQNNIYLGGQIGITDPREMNEREIEQQEVTNLNHLIFSLQQLEDRKKRRFASRSSQYKGNKALIKKVQQMQKMKNLTYEVLQPITQEFFIEKARQKWKTQFAATDEEIKTIDRQILIDTYAQNNKTARPIIAQALSQTKKYCNQYISTRNDLALLNSFRVMINAPKLTSKQESREEIYRHQHEVLNDESPEDQNLTFFMNLFFVTKYKNGGKLSSHNWFFNGFCEQLKPQYAILLDVGLAPEKDALWKMCSHMQRNPTVGGVCGYMGLRMQKLGDDEEVKDEQVDCITALCMKVVDIQRTQQFEYHFAHLIDKPFESSGCFKFIHVLPGAFSGYRMKALRPDNGTQSQLLKQYFKAIQQNKNTTYVKSQDSVFKTVCKVFLPDFFFQFCFGKPLQNSYQQLLYDQNVYLAEDRTLCMGIHQNGYDLAYLPDSYAWVDPIKTLYGLLGQRKRWINGSYFAFQKVKGTLQKSAGDCCLGLQIYYLTLLNMLSFISPALFMFTVHIAMYTFQQNVIFKFIRDFNIVPIGSMNKGQNLFVNFFDLLYVLIFLGLVFFSMHLTNRVGKFKSFFYGVSTLYGVFSLSVFGVLLYDIISGFTGKNTFLIQNPGLIESIAGGEQMISSLRYVMLGIMGVYAFPVVISLIFGRFDHVIDILTSLLSFLFYSPTYLNILNIYALCRMDDISWGTKGLNAEESGRNREMTEQWKKVKLLHVSKFVLYNIVAGFLLLVNGDNYTLRFWLTFGIMVLLGFTLIFKVIIGSMYMISYKCCNKMEQKKQEIKNEDRITKFFQRVKKSLYKQVKTSTMKFEQDYKEEVGQDSSKNIIGTFQFSSIMKSNIKKNSQKNKLSSNSILQKARFSNIQKKAAYQSFKAIKEQEKEQDQVNAKNLKRANQQSKMEVSSGKNSTGELREFVIQEENKKQKKGTKRRVNKIL